MWLKKLLIKPLNIIVWEFSVTAFLIIAWRMMGSDNSFDINSVVLGCCLITYKYYEFFLNINIQRICSMIFIFLMLPGVVERVLFNSNVSEYSGVVLVFKRAFFVFGLYFLALPFLMKHRKEKVNNNG